MDEKFKDLLDDEELAALRSQALASKGRNKNVDNSSSSVSALPINSIVTSESVSSQIPFVQSDRNVYNNHSWRKQNHLSRRRGGAFPKSSQRSNLIVISPISVNDSKDSEEKAPALILPQHKWCNSGNEDSMSPKTLRRTGPTRFNRHGSDSESSDSDFENSENDSESNETVLQDEPEHFSPLSPKNDAVPETAEKQRRLSFQNLETDIQSDEFEKSETTSVYKCLKNSVSHDYAKSQLDNFTPMQNINDNNHEWNSSVGNDYNSYKPYSSGHSYSSKPLDSSESFVEKQNRCAPQNGESHNENDRFIVKSSDATLWQHTGVKANNSHYSSDVSSIPENVRNCELSERISRDYSIKGHSYQVNSEIQGSNNFVWKHKEAVKTNNSYVSRDSAHSKTVSRTYSDNSNVKSREKSLSGDDLRFELKKRMQEMQGKSAAAAENCSDFVDWQKTGCGNSQDRNKRRHAYGEDRTDLYGSRQDLSSNLLRSRQDQSVFLEKNTDDLNLNFNSRGVRRSSSQERNKQEGSTLRDRTRSEYTLNADKYDCSSNLQRNKLDIKSGKNSLERSCSRDRSRHERSSSRGRNRHERSSSRGRNRHERSSSRGRNRSERSSSGGKGRYDRSSSQGRRRYERSSSRGRGRHESSSSQERRDESSYDKINSESNIKNLSPNQDRNKQEYQSSQEMDKQEDSTCQARNRQGHLSNDGGKHNPDRYERRYSPKSKRYARSRSRDRSNRKNRRNHSSSDRSSSRDSRSEFDSSSDSRHERSFSRDRSGSEYSSSRERKRFKQSQSRDRSKEKRSQSRDRSRHKKSSSEERTKYGISRFHKRSSHERSQSDDSRSKHTPTQNKNKQVHSMSHDRGKKESNSVQRENQVEINETKNNFESRKSESLRNSEILKEEQKITKTKPKEQEQKRQMHRRSQEKSVNKRHNQKFGKERDSKVKDRYSRSRSGSTTSCSSTSSSWSSRSLKPKMRSVPSVVKPFLPKSLDADKKENIFEVKVTGKKISSSQSDLGSTSSKKDSIDYKFSNVKCGRLDVDSKASDNKRVPVHMRLGVLPRKRLIQMPKDVEAAFVNSSSSSEGESVNTKCKRQNIRIVTDVYGIKSGIDFEKKPLGKEKSSKRCDMFQDKPKRLKTHR